MDAPADHDYEDDFPPPLEMSSLTAVTFEECVDLLVRERVVNPKPRARSDGLTYAKRVARWFVKNLSNANGFGALEKFVEAIKIGKNEPTKCVSIPQYTKFRIIKNHDPVHPYLAATRVWRWPSMRRARIATNGECRVAPGEICANPYHYVCLDAPAVTVDGMPRIKMVKKEHSGAICPVLGCKSRTGVRGMSWFKPPDKTMDGERCQKWIAACTTTTIDELRRYRTHDIVKDGFGKNTRVCSRHFLPAEVETHGKKIRLSKSAVATLNLPCDLSPSDPNNRRNRGSTKKSMVDELWAFVSNKENENLWRGLKDEVWSQLFVDEDATVLGRIRLKMGSSSLDDVEASADIIKFSRKMVPTLYCNNLKLPSYSYLRCVTKGAVKTMEQVIELFTFDFDKTRKFLENAEAEIDISIRESVSQTDSVLQLIAID